MPKIVKITLKEKDELEPILVKDLESIEDGLKVLAHQFPTDSGPLDILAVDTDGAAVVIELKDNIDDGQLDQGLRYYDWVRSNRGALSKAYPSIMAAEEPRLILIAPAFSDSLKRICPYVTLNANELLELKEYHAIKLPNNEIGILTTNIDIGSSPEEPEPLSMDEKMKHIKNDRIRDLCKEAIGELESNGVEIRPIRGHWASLWHKGKRFGHMGFRKQFFVLHIMKSDGDWYPLTRILTKDDWSKQREVITESCRRISDTRTI
jgi:hypothetical protein